jgi:eukaryotic-like serine/threonine-protein kinase
MSRALNHDPTYLERFKREARAASGISHPNVVRVMDFGSHDGLPFLVMEYVPGVTLSIWQSQLGRLPSLAEVVTIFEQILAALDAIHEQGIVHRDVKPANTSCRLDDKGQLHVKLLDFGLAGFFGARHQDAQLTRLDSMAGTPEYMSPEQSRSLRVGPASDLYAAGCILTQLLQGAPPFVAEAVMDVLSHQVYSPPPPLSRPAEAEAIPAGLEALRLELLAKQPARRPASAAVVRQRLSSVMDSDGHAASRSSPPGARADRIPSWNSPAIEAAPALTEVPVLTLIRIQVRDGGVDDSCCVGLRALGYQVNQGAADPNSVRGVVLLDVGDLLPADAGLLPDWSNSPEPPRVLVCGARLGIEEMNGWIAVGAADVAPYPVSCDDLAKRVHRLMRVASISSLPPRPVTRP